MNKYLFISVLLRLSPTRAYVPNIPSPSFQNTNSQLTDLAIEIEEIWSNAAAIGEDSSEETLDFVQSRALDYKNRVKNRVTKQTDKLKRTSKTPFVTAGAESTEDMTAMKQYQNALDIALRSFSQRVDAAEEKLTFELDEIIEAYNDNLSSTSVYGMTEDDIFLAKERHIQNSAIAEELFQVALDTAEVAYREAVLTAEENLNELVLL
mmetsp:Transcript_18748/g.28307  ORF Transcript_18748/g.28307 Transcript_18748/m.28307 type:complete len:208 (-) Transcript_18748:78-701(-)